MSEAMNPMLTRLLVLYGEPDSADPKALMGEYADALKGYTDGELGKATDKLRDERRYKTWPTPRECVDACESVRKAIRAEMYLAKVNAKKAEEAKPVERTPAEQAELERFVNEWAAGKRVLHVPSDAPNDKKIEMGLLSRRLRSLAKQMRMRRQRGTA